MKRPRRRIDCDTRVLQPPRDRSVGLICDPAAPGSPLERLRDRVLALLDELAEAVPSARAEKGRDVQRALGALLWRLTLVPPEEEIEVRADVIALTAVAICVTEASWVPTTGGFLPSWVAEIERTPR